MLNFLFALFQFFDRKLQFLVLHAIPLAKICLKVFLVIKNNLFFDGAISHCVIIIILIWRQKCNLNIINITYFN